MARIKVVQITPDHFVGMTSLDALRGHSPNPMVVDNASDSVLDGDRTLARAAKQRGTNQRKFGTPRIRRTEAYANYIEMIKEGRLGGYPPITLWTEDDCTLIDGELHIAGASILTANDGETQLAARYMLAERDGKWLDEPFAVTITINSTKQCAAQTLHDMNTFATPVTEKETAVLNVMGPLTAAINDGKAAASTTPRIKERGNTPTALHDTSAQRLLAGAVGAVLGNEALDRSVATHLKRLNGQSVDIDTSAAIEFTKQVLELPPAQLREIDEDQMLALGIHFANTGELARPLSPARIKAEEARLKRELRIDRKPAFKRRVKALTDIIR